MPNAVEKMFDMTLFNSRDYFPEDSTCPDKFWDAIDELEEELSVKIDITHLCKKDSPEQLKQAKNFCRGYVVHIKKNPFDFDRMIEISNGHGCIIEYLNEFALFEREIKTFFKYHMRILISTESNKRALHVLS